MPRKLPSAYVRKLNEEQKLQKTVAANRRSQQERRETSTSASSRVKGFIMICQACGTRSNFTVDSQGHATCNKCKAIAPYRIANVA